MEGALSSFLHSPFSSLHSNLSLVNKSISPFLSPPLSKPRPLVSPKPTVKKTRKPNSAQSKQTTDSKERARNSGHYDPRKKTQKLNLEVSPHRAVSAVRLLRIEQGGAFAALLNDKGRNSSERGMGYVERTLGFRTRDLDDRDIRLVLVGESLIKQDEPGKGIAGVFGKDISI